MFRQSYAVVFALVVLCATSSPGRALDCGEYNFYEEYEYETTGVLHGAVNHGPCEEVALHEEVVTMPNYDQVCSEAEGCHVVMSPNTSTCVFGGLGPYSLGVGECVSERLYRTIEVTTIGEWAGPPVCKHSIRTHAAHHIEITYYTCD